MRTSTGEGGSGRQAARPITDETCQGLEGEMPRSQVRLLRIRTTVIRLFGYVIMHESVIYLPIVA